MKPLEGNSLSDLDRLHKENDFQGERRNEVREFWKSGYKLAELRTSGKVALDTEINNYKKAARQLYSELHFDYLRDISFHIRQGKIIVVRTKKNDTSH